MALTPEQWNEAFGTLIGFARERPDKRMPIQDQTGAIVAHVVVHDLPKRPTDMPRAHRPKMKLSKRQRDRAKRQKLGHILV